MKLTADRLAGSLRPLRPIHPRLRNFPRLLSCLASALRPGVLLLPALLAPRSVMTQAVRVQPKHFVARPELLVCALCSLTVSASPTSMTFSLIKLATATGSTPVVITTSETGITLQSSIKLFGYFNAASAALTDGRATPDNIPTSAVLGQMTTGTPTSYTAFTGSTAVGPAGAGLQLFSTGSMLSIGCLPLVDACRTDSLNLEINLSGLPQLPAGMYTGTLNLQAQAM